MISQYDDISGDERRARLERADSDYMARLNRQLSMAQACAEEIAEILVRVDLNEEDDLRRSVEHISDVAANARVFLLEALENKRLRKALEG